MAQYKTPGVYIVEKNAFPNSIVEVATAVPAFIGYTSSADYKGSSLTNRPWRISSMAEFEAHFGAAPNPMFTFSVSGDAGQVDFSAVAAKTGGDDGSAGSRDAALKATAATAKQAAETAKAALDAATAATSALTAAAKPTTGTDGSGATASSVKTLRDAADGAKAALDKAAEADKVTSAAAFKKAGDLATAAEATAEVAANAAQLKTELARSIVKYSVTKASGKHLLYYSMKLFFQNGGGACYVVSVGDYSKDPDATEMQDGIDLLLKEQEPTMLLIPEAVLLSKDDCYALQQQMLLHCGDKMKNRFALLDVYNGSHELQDGPVNDFRNGVNSPFLAFGAAYYPWVNTTIVALKDLNFTFFGGSERITLKDLISNELAPVLYADTTKNPSAKLKSEQIRAILKDVGDWPEAGADAQKIPPLHNTLVAISPLYSRVLMAAQRQVNLLPPGAAMAGLYTMVDDTHGVWKAPANVSLASVSSPAVNITHDDQEDLNVSTTGKSINAIRSFIGEGTLVWGAHTLDGNSLDWRYINVRRTMIMIEESLRLASKAYVFEPNVANTWVTLKSMVRNFLTSIWKRGGLAGAVPDDAFSVAVGLNETMTSDDILEGILRVTILVAVSRPAEFIEITFQQQMQKS